VSRRRTASRLGHGVSVTFTLIGSVGFLIGSLLMLPETAASASGAVD